VFFLNTVWRVTNFKMFAFEVFIFFTHLLTYMFMYIIKLNYQTIFQVDAKLEGQVFFVPFSASAQYQKVHSQTYMHQKKYVSTAARCNVYRANIKLLSMNRLSPDFVKAKHFNCLTVEEKCPVSV